MDERPVGWYRDPDDTRAHRYWDGQTWAVAQVVPPSLVPPGRPGVVQQDPSVVEVLPQQ